MCKKLYDCFVLAKNILQVNLENGNPEVHPGPCLLNAGRIDFSGGEFWLYREGITEHTINVLEAVEKERIALGRALGFEVEGALEARQNRGYFSQDEKTLQEHFNTSEVFTQIKGPTSVTSRYFTEDISTPCPSNTCKTSIESSFMHIQPVIAYSVGKNDLSSSTAKVPERKRVAITVSCTCSIILRRCS